MRNRHDTCGCGGKKRKDADHCLDCEQNSRKKAVPSTTHEEVTAGPHRIITAKVDRVLSEADFVAKFAIDLKVWEIVEFRCSASETMSVPRATGKSKDWERPSTEPVITPLYHVSGKLRRKVEVVNVREEVAQIVAEAKAAIRAMPVKFTPFKLAKLAKGVMVEFAIPDLHMGRLAWADETGEANYDSAIAAALFDEALNALVARTAGQHIEKIIFPIGNDLVHSDNKAGTTTAGTPLDNDSRYHKVFRRTRLLMQNALERLATIAPVEAPIVPGNHDTLAAFHLGEALDCYFARQPHITIDNAPTLRKYKQFGQVMLLFTHGNRGKLAEYPLLMASEQRQMWGETRFREAHTGDKHQTRVQEFKGVKVRISPALCPSDAWHSEHHFVGNGRGAEAYVWERNEGLIGQAYYTVAESNKVAQEQEAA